MAFDYGYGELGNEMIEVLQRRTPDFVAAEELLHQGADLNARGYDEEENMLSQILSEFGPHWIWGDESGETERVSCGAAMCEVIRFFLSHGFDVTRDEGCYGAQCLFALTLTTFDRYMLEAMKLLLDAGAKNRIITRTSTDPDETPKAFVGTEGSFQGTIQKDFAVSNLFEAAYQIYEAIETGRPYRGIDSYEVAVGKKILGVLAESDEGQPIFFPQKLPEFHKENCYTKTLYFVYEGGALITTQYADFWTDTVLPEIELVDVSDHFSGIINSSIKEFQFDCNTVLRDGTNHPQPITTIQMDTGRRIRFSINFGLVEEKHRAAYFELF